MNLWIKKIIVWSLCLSLLIGVTFSGYSDVLCIGSDGQLELETLCLPCTDTEDTCEYNISDAQHEEHSNCIDCLDIKLTNSLWTKRSQKTDFGKSIKLTLASAAFATCSLTMIEQNNSCLTKYSKLYIDNPCSSFLTTTVILC